MTREMQETSREQYSELNVFYSMTVDGQEVGEATVIEYEDGSVLIERIDIEEDFRNAGHGTWFINQLSRKYGDVYLAAENEDCARLYDRLGTDVTSDDVWGYLDQGFGVYRV